MRKGNKKESAESSAVPKKDSYERINEYKGVKNKRKGSKKIKVKINPMKKISGFKEVKQGGNNETKKGLYPY